MMRFVFFLLVVCAAVLRAATPVEFSVGAFAFDRPSGWEWIVPSSPMRKAQLNVPASEGNPAEVTFFHFGPGQGGGIQANIDRWFGQFQDAKVSQREESISGIRVVFATAEGTFFSGMPGGPLTPMPGYGMRSAILQDENGGDVFVKMTGPLELVTAASVAFDAMIHTSADSSKP